MVSSCSGVLTGCFLMINARAMYMSPVGKKNVIANAMMNEIRIHATDRLRVSAIP